MAKPPKSLRPEREWELAFAGTSDECRFRTERRPGGLHYCVVHGKANAWLLDESNGQYRDQETGQVVDLEAFRAQAHADGAAAAIRFRAAQDQLAGEHYVPGGHSAWLSNCPLCNPGAPWNADWKPRP